VREGGAGSLAGKRVVVTRAAQQSGALVKALQEAGASVVMLPLLAFAAPEDSSGLDAALRGAAEFDWILLTSQNAVAALQERCAVLQISLADAFVRVRVAAVGPATASAAENAGLKISRVATKHQGVALAEELGKQVAEKRVFLPRSDLANRELPKTLQRLGARVTEVVAYKTIVPSGDELRQARSLLRDVPDVILFFSPSAVHHMHELLGQDFLAIAKHAIVAAIGPVTRNALSHAGVERILVAKDTTVDATVNALSEYFSKAVESSHAGVRKG
jgi:uroporphyrinogen-III synthase